MSFLPSSRAVVFQPEVYKSWQQGIDKLVGAIAPTLGPLPKHTGIDIGLNRSPELLDNGGVIARRIIELPDKDEDVGAMFLRSALWKMSQEVGDGTATSAVIFQKIYQQGIRYINAGGNAMSLRNYLESALQTCLDKLSVSARPLTSKEDITQLAGSVCSDPALAKTFGSVFDVIGGYGRLEIEAGRGRETEHQFVDGAYWRSSQLLNQEYAGQISQRRFFADSSVFLSNLSFNSPPDLLPVLEAAKDSRRRTLLLVVNELSDSIKGLLRANNKPGIFEIVAVKTPGTGLDDQVETLSDLALLTGGRVFLSDIGDTAADISASDLGYARRIWTDRTQMGIARGGGEPAAILEQFEQLKRKYDQETSAAKLLALEKRMGCLLGGSAIIWVGGATETEIDTNKDTADRVAKTLRSGLIYGVQPGGGTAYLGLAEELYRRAESAEGEEQAAFRILAKGLEAPLAQILENLGYEVGPVISEMGEGYFYFDSSTGKLEFTTQQVILDSHFVLQEALRRAVMSAALALTTDVIIHLPNPERAMSPE